MNRITLLLAFTLAGCHTIPPAEPVKIDASLLQQCPKRPLLKAGDGKTVTRWSAEMVHLYEECSLGKRALIEAVKPAEK